MLTYGQERIALFLIWMLLAGLVVLSPVTVNADQIDPACASAKPSPGGPLKVLGSCVKLYCRKTVKAENTRDNIKFIDEVLVTLNVRNTSFSEKVGAYQAACRALLKNYCKSCKLEDNAQTAVLLVQMDHALAEESARIVLAQDGFSHFGGVVAKVENDLACSSQILQSAKKAVDFHHLTIQRFSDTKCSK